MTTGIEALTNGRISTKRLRAAIAKVNLARKNGIGLPKYPVIGQDGVADLTQFFRALGTYSKESKMVSAERATLLYSLRSHLRGRLHITHQYVQEKGTDGSCKEVCYPRTMEDQEKLVAPLWAEFRMTDEEAQLDAELRAKRIALYGQCNTGPTPTDPVDHTDYGCQS